MLRILSAVLAVGLILSTSASAQTDLSGAWDLAVQGPEGPVNATATLKQDGEKVTGEIESQAGQGRTHRDAEGQDAEHGVHHAGSPGPDGYQGNQ